MSDSLTVVVNGALVGEVRQERGKVSFSYTEEWQESEEAHPLSLSMPLPKRDHKDEVVAPFLEGLLPDNDAILERWARQFGVSARNPFSLLRYVGEEVAGAAQYVRPENLDAMLEQDDRVEWLTEKDVGDRLRGLVEDHGAWRSPDDVGYFSLAGVQPKTALRCVNGRWGVPYGATPTTHILKPPVMKLRGFAENEHLCLSLAQVVGLSAANSELKRFDGAPVVVVERYDRQGLLRIHQEDFCQATSVSPRTKYENEGGPTAETIVSILRNNSSDPGEDVERFIDSLALNWVIGGSDAHGKNYSMLIAPGGQVRLAPLYDLISILPYPDLGQPDRMKLAMKVGGEYRIGYIRSRHWRRFAEAAELDAQEVVARVRRMVESVGESVDKLAASEIPTGFDTEFGELFASKVSENVQRCLSSLEDGHEDHR